MKKEFIYYDVDTLQSFDGWYEARLQNRLNEGYLIWRDENLMAWRGELKKKNK